MKKYIYIIFTLCMAQLAIAQAPTTIVKEGNYTVTGTVTLSATQSITLKPNTWIKSGSTFTAEIVESNTAEEPYLSFNFSNENYVFTRNFQREMQSFNPNTAKEGDVIEQLVYIDGLGRPIQQLALKASPTKKDIITHIDYDSFGRSPKTYLPFETSGGVSSYRTNAATGTDDYYKLHYPDDINNSLPNPFSEMEYEHAPLNRVEKQAAPGYDWRLDGGHEVETVYGTNGTNEVRLFTVTTTFANNTYTPSLVYNNGEYYAAGELQKNTIKDENHSSGTDHTVEEFTDKKGRVVLKRAHNNGDHDTYYVYDDFGNLTYVLPPKVTTSNVSPTELNELCYQYKYDERNRLVEKKIPGKDWESIVYNKLDQPAMTQDPNLEANGQWLFTKYDPFGRVAYTGRFPDGSSSRADRQNFQNGVTTPYETKSTSPITVDNTQLYYSNNVIPTHNQELYTISYYDNYVFDKAGIALPTGNILGQVQATDVSGLPTGSKVRVLDTDDWITTITLYDEKGRPIYVHSKNEYLNSEDIIETKLDFAGKVIQTKTTHIKDGNTPAIVTIDNFSYDHEARLVKQEQVLGGETELIAKNTYDGIGQLVTKEVGNTFNAPLQEIDYTYNVRGWLKKINDPTTSLGNDLFAFEIDYNEGSNALYNGNIAKTAWKTANDNVLRHYNYTYDALNRLKIAGYNTATSSEPGWFNVTNISYDKNGNLLSLNRAKKGTSSAGAAMDYLTYSYDSGNKLMRVEDQFDGAGSFEDGSNTGDDYTYDSNGNMISDANKHISSISYNHLNLPTQVVVSGGGNDGNIQYIYDATGIKLKKIVSEGSSLTATEYCGNYVYEQLGNSAATLQFFNTAEGYVEPDGSGGYDYIFQCKDHLGNIRLSYNDANNDQQITSNEIREENNYYPFGLKHKGYNSNTNGRNHKYGFTGKEEQNEIGLDWIDITARNYDPALGRWMNLDPLAEEMRRHSPYNYAFDNPIFFIDPDGMMPCPNGDCYEIDSSSSYTVNEDGSHTVQTVSTFSKETETVDSNGQITKTNTTITSTDSFTVKAVRGENGKVKLVNESSTRKIETSETVTTGFNTEEGFVKTRSDTKTNIDGQDGITNIDLSEQSSIVRNVGAVLKSELQVNINFVGTDFFVSDSAKDTMDSFILGAGLKYTTPGVGAGIGSILGSIYRNHIRKNGFKGTTVPIQNKSKRFKIVNGKKIPLIKNTNDLQ